MNIEELETLAEEIQKKINASGLEINKKRDEIGKNIQVAEDSEVHPVSAVSFLPLFFETGLILFLLIWTFYSSLGDLVPVLSVPLIFFSFTGLLFCIIATKASDAYERWKNNYWRITSLLFFAVFAFTVYHLEPDVLNPGLFACLAIQLMQMVYFKKYTEKYNVQKRAANIENNRKNSEAYQSRVAAYKHTESRMRNQISLYKMEYDEVIGKIEKLKGE